jgi:hypothetical protein
VLSGLLVILAFLLFPVRHVDVFLCSLGPKHESNGYGMALLNQRRPPLPFRLLLPADQQNTSTPQLHTRPLR